MNSTNEPIRGKVARILNSRELALNIGSKDGVQIGMEFDVLDPKGEQIRDPDTGEVLGSLDRPKVRVKIKSVQERLSVATTFRGQKVNVGGSRVNISSLAVALMPEKWVTKYETLKTDEATWEDLDEEQSIVKSGDPVVQVVNSPNEEVMGSGR